MSNDIISTIYHMIIINHLHTHTARARVHTHISMLVGVWINNYDVSGLCSKDKVADLVFFSNSTCKLQVSCCDSKI